MDSRYKYVAIMMLAGCVLLVAPGLSVADHTPNPSVVTTPGDYQSELGCPGDWDPGCAVTNLLYDVTCDVWSNTFNIPAGSWEYKAALNGTWDENYGDDGVPGGANIPFTVGEGETVHFSYDHTTHILTIYVGVPSVQV